MQHGPSSTTRAHQTCMSWRRRRTALQLMEAHGAWHVKSQNLLQIERNIISYRRQRAFKKL